VHLFDIAVSRAVAAQAHDLALARRPAPSLPLHCAVNVSACCRSCPASADITPASASGLLRISGAHLLRYTTTP
jgi:hypothetical protein